MKLNETLKHYRLRRGRTQKECAELLNMSQSAYSDIESGITKIKAEDFLKLINFLDIEISIFQNSDNKLTLKLSNNEVVKLQEVISFLQNLSEKLK